MTIHQTDMQAASRPLSGKTALVTGSTSGIGLGVATTLANAGANIVLNGFGDPAAIKALARGLGSASKVGVIYSGADLSRLQELEAMMSEATRRFGGVDILVNNAGIQHVAPVESFPVEKWDQILAINLSSAFHTARLALPHMRSKGWGRIINIASAHGLVASPFKSAYVAAKHGVIGLTKTIALEAAEALAVMASRGDVHARVAFLSLQVALAGDPRRQRAVLDPSLVREETEDAPEEEPQHRVPDYGRGRPLTLGERKSLARKPDRRMFDRVLRDPHPDVIALLLQNPRLTETDVVRLCSRRPGVAEVLSRVFASRWSLRPDSGGAGRHRGGLGAIYEIELLEEQADVFLFGERGRFAPPGVLGGEPAALNRFSVIRKDGTVDTPPMASKWVGIKLAKNERVRLETPGGGGFGPARERPEASIARDIENGYVTPEAARRAYGKTGAA